MIVREADADCDAPALLAVINDAIINSTAWYEYEPWNAARMTSWLAAKRAGNWPVLVADAGSGALGFASFGTFRERPAYARTVEHSVYVDAKARGRGIGRLMLAALIAEARARGMHTMIGAVDAANPGSLAFHHALGFLEVGRIREVAWKFDRWLDLIFMQKLL